MKQLTKTIYWFIALFWIALVSYVIWKSIENFLTLQNGPLVSYFCVIVMFCVGIVGVVQTLNVASHVTAWIMGEQVPKQP
jgi:Kef-type K+ transport system membrane component KefB